MTIPRAYTEDEIRDQLLDHINYLVKYWNGEGNSNVDPLSSSRYKLEGLAFSICSALDSSFLVARNPHPEDREYCESCGENWYPEGVDIAGCLHELIGGRRNLVDGANNDN